MDMRELKGMEIAARSRIAFEDGAWAVPSQSSGGKYRVTLKPDSCNCEDFQLRKQACKHVIAARLVQERDYGGQAPKIDTAAVPKRPTYKQVWPAYNLAQTTEKHRFQVLLTDLCAGLQEPERPLTRGRRPHLLRDSIFAMTYKVYSTFSSRRFHSDLADAYERGHLVNPVPGMKVSSFFENADLTLVLRALIARSAMPLKAVETEFAVDSSGFSTSKFERWYDEKYGVHRSGRAWIKVHIAVGVKTNIVTAANILDRDAADCPQFAPLVGTTAANFAINEVSGDKAYLSNANLEMIEALGGTAFVPFKSNSVDGEGIWGKMFHYFQFRREEFLQHYHKRSNVESVFSAAKRKFGDAVRSKSNTAMVNEVYCKLLAHNLCAVIQEQCELGIEPVFWADAPKTESCVVLPMVRPG
jgi:transposase